MATLLVSIVSTFIKADFETRRLLSRALCNLAATESGVVETFGNLSEDEHFHSNLVHFIDKNQFFDQLMKIVDTEIRREVAGFAANLASAKSTHTFLLEAGIIQYFSCLCSLQDASSAC
jgi:hypothetical protein